MMSLDFAAQPITSRGRWLFPAADDGLSIEPSLLHQIHCIFLPKVVVIIVLPALYIPRDMNILSKQTNPSII